MITCDTVIKASKILFWSLINDYKRDLQFYSFISFSILMKFFSWDWQIIWFTITFKFQFHVSFKRRFHQIFFYQEIWYSFKAFQISINISLSKYQSSAKSKEIRKLPLILCFRANFKIISKKNHRFETASRSVLTC